ncbi:MAG: polyprenyl synthetase family protein [Candidatus Hadarchaeales archaeon]
MDVLRFITQRVEMVERELERWVPSKGEPKELFAASRHLLRAGGKRLRPCLLVISCEAVGGDGRKVLGAAAAIELLHTFTLIHDDIMDSDEIRRNVKTVHVLWGEPIAIVAGDALFAKVFEILSENTRALGLDGKTTAEIIGAVSRTSFEICAGQTMDILFEKREDVTEKEYLKMVEGKTGALIEASTKIGAILGGGSRKEIDALASYGRKIGVAFQIRDDVLGLVGEIEKFGKPVGSDIREGKKTLVVVRGLSVAGPAERKKLLAVLGKRDASEKEIREAIDLLKETGSIEYAEKKAEILVEEAKSKLKVLRDSDAKNALLKIADFVIRREF